MTEWWTYRLEDFLMFAPGTYQRMFALYNAQVWPAPLLALPLGLALLWGLARRPVAWRLACATVAAGWAFTAWAFHWQRYAGIHTAAPWFAAGFAVQALVLIWIARPGSPWRLRAGPGWARGVGLMLLAFAVLLQPWTGLAFGRPWQQAALLGLTPDATAVGTMGMLLVLAHGRSAAAGALPWVLPLLWCMVSAATLWTLGAPETFVLPGLAIVAVGTGLAAARAARAGAGATRAGAGAARAGAGGTPAGAGATRAGAGGAQAVADAARPGAGGLHTGAQAPAPQSRSA